jgi:hypothetical protein
VITKLKDLTKELDILKLEKSEQSELLNQTLTKNQELQNLTNYQESELIFLRGENAVTQAKIREQQAMLSQLIPTTPAVFEMPRIDLHNLLKKFNAHSGGALFASKPSDETLESLKLLVKSKETVISMEQIKSCIKDNVLLEIFNNPFAYHDSVSLNRTGIIVRELSFVFRQPHALTNKASEFKAS